MAAAGVGAGGEQRADDGDAGDGVGAGHQRGVQLGGDLGDQLEAEEDRQHEDEEQQAHVSGSFRGKFFADERSLTISPSWVTQAALDDLVVAVRG